MFRLEYNVKKDVLKQDGGRCVVPDVAIDVKKEYPECLSYTLCWSLRVGAAVRIGI